MKKPNKGISPYGNLVLLLCMQTIPRASERNPTYPELERETLCMCVDTAAQLARVHFVMRVLGTMTPITPGAGMFCAGERELVIEALVIALARREVICESSLLRDL